MFEEYEKKKRRQVTQMRSLTNYGMGILFFLGGCFFFFRNKLDIPFNDRFPPDDLDKILGGMCIVYGIWRIYRGYKKNYFR